MIIREANVSDAEWIAALTRELGYDTTSQAIAERLSRLLGRSDQRTSVAIFDDHIAGWIQGQASEVLESGYRVEIVGLIVSEKYRRQGVGRSLVQDIERWAEMVGASAVAVRSNVSRKESHLFYPALGYETVKTQAVYRKRFAPTPGKAPDSTVARPAAQELRRP